jgi:hypothetical protein
MGGNYSSSVSESNWNGLVAGLKSKILIFDPGPNEFRDVVRWQDLRGANSGS